MLGRITSGAGVPVSDPVFLAADSDRRQGGQRGDDQNRAELGLCPLEEVSRRCPVEDGAAGRRPQSLSTGSSSIP